MADIWYELKH